VATNTTSNKSGAHSAGSGQASTMAELMAKQGQGVQVLQKGATVEGTIKKLTAQEILMDIGGKGDALVIEYDKQNLENLLSTLHVGDKVSASVISPESEEGFPVLSLRRMLSDAIFNQFEKLAASDEPFEITITESSRGGYMGTTEQGVKGFLPTSQVTDEDPSTGSGQGNLMGKKIMVKIIEADRAKKRVVFSQKALSFLTNADEIKKLFKNGDKVKADVANVTPYGLFVVMTADKAASAKGSGEPRKVEGFVHISEVSYDRVENLSSLFKSGDKIEAEVVEIDTSNKRVNLSIKRGAKDTFADVETKYKVEDKVKGEITDVRSRGVTVKLGEGVNGFIPADKIGSGTTYGKGQNVDATVVEFDKKRRMVVLSPILKAVPIGYR
jgi:small subunit ribosomal protein S1